MTVKKGQTYFFSNVIDVFFFVVIDVIKKTINEKQKIYISDVINEKREINIFQLI